MIALAETGIPTTADPAWGDCRFLTCSVLPVRMACNLSCPFCFSKSSVSQLRSDPWWWDLAEVESYYRFALDRGATRLVVTGGGEPLLRPGLVVDLVSTGHRVFEEVALFTNASRLTPALARRLADAGLSYICYSRHAADDDENRALMGAEAPNLAEVAASAASCSLKIRATCVMTRGHVEDRADVARYIAALCPFGVSEFTFKHTYVAYEGSVFSGSAEDSSARASRRVRPVQGRGGGRRRTPLGPGHPPHRGAATVLLPRADARLGEDAPHRPLDEPPVGRLGLCLPGGSVEPAVPAGRLIEALADDGAEPFRALLPVGYSAGVDAYRAAVEGLTAEALSNHYTDGLGFFRETFAPQLAIVLADLSGGAWDLSGHVAYAAGSDVDFMTHVVEAIASREGVALFPGDWFGFRVGSTHQDRIRWDASGRAALACLCIPSVRNGHLTSEMLDFLSAANACLLNLNLFPTLAAEERNRVARALVPVLDRSVLSISFSRGFGMTASQLGVILVPRDHPYRRRFATQWDWFTYFHNALAARAFLALDAASLKAVDRARRAHVASWLDDRGLPSVRSGSYYVKSFRVEGEVPDPLRPLARDGVVRLCFKPPQT